MTLCVGSKRENSILLLLLLPETGRQQEQAAAALVQQQQQRESVRRQVRINTVIRARRQRRQRRRRWWVVVGAGGGGIGAERARELVYRSRSCFSCSVAAASNVVDYQYPHTRQKGKGQVRLESGLATSAPPPQIHPTTPPPNLLMQPCLSIVPGIDFFPAQAEKEIAEKKKKEKKKGNKKYERGTNGRRNGSIARTLAHELQPWNIFILFFGFLYYEEKEQPTRIIQGK